MNTPILAITRGYAGSGKTTVAEHWVSAAPDGERRARVNRDALRDMLFKQEGVLGFQLERAVSTAQRAQVSALLQSGVSVVVDDTNLRMQYARNWADLAAELSVPFEVWDLYTSADECVRRDQARYVAGGRSVGERAIRDMADKFRFPLPEVTPRPPKEGAEFVPTPYVARPDLPDAWVIDVDGTLAKKKMGEGTRDWYDYSRVHEDDPHRHVIDVVQGLNPDDEECLKPRAPQIIVLSGRDDSCMPETRKWLDEHLGAYTVDELYMRTTGDQRPDTVIKHELFDAHVRDRFNVIGVLDDRPVVCRMWRAMGLATLQAGDPHFEF